MAELVIGHLYRFPGVVGEWELVEVCNEVVIGRGPLLHFMDTRFRLSRYRSLQDVEMVA